MILARAVPIRSVRSVRVDHGRGISMPTIGRTGKCWHLKFERVPPPAPSPLLVAYMYVCGDTDTVTFVCVAILPHYLLELWRFLMIFFSSNFCRAFDRSLRGRGQARVSDKCSGNAPPNGAKKKKKRKRRKCMKMYSTSDGKKRVL